MKKYLLFFSKYSQIKLKTCLITALFLTSTFVIGQTITPTKTVIKNVNSCSIIDVELKVQGANPVARPLEVMLVIDVSGSMGNTISGDANTSMDYAKDAAVDFINTFFLPANNPTGLNKVGIVTYSTTGLLRQGLTPVSGQAGLLTIINGLNANGNTNIQDGIVKADNELIANGTYNCSTARSIILLTDGVANRTGAGGSSCTAGTGGTCIQSAITAATNAKTHTVSSVLYNNQIFSVGLFGGISGTDQTNAQFCLNGIQSGGSYFTESGANLSGIYTQIFTQLSWVAAQITGTPFAKETVSTDFNIVAGSITVSKGTFSQVGQIIDWNIDFLNVETITLKYQLTPKPNVCGDRIVSTSRLDYRNSTCSTAFQNVTTPNYCVPCAPLLSALPAPSTISCPAIPSFATPTVTNGCQSSNLTFVDVRTNGNCASSYSVTRTWTASNACFTANVSQTINVNDTTNPTASNPANITLTGCNGTFPAPDVSVVIDESDACSTPTVTFVSDGQPTLNGCIETTVRTYKVTDACGNFINVTQNLIRTKDTTNPTASNPANITLTGCNGTFPAPDVSVVTNEADTCSTPTVTFVSDGQPTLNGCIETTIRTYKVTDACGNFINVTQNLIRTKDTTNPTASNPANITLTGCNGTFPAPDVSVVTNEADACSTPTVAFVSDGQPTLNGCIETTIRTYKVTDACGNFINVTQNLIRTKDTTNPTASNPANITLTGCNGTFPAPDVSVVIDESDACSVPTVTFVSDGQPTLNGCIETTIRTYKVTDACGNFINVTQNLIRTKDTTNPTASNPANITLAGCNGTFPAPDVSVVTNEADACSTPTVTFISDSQPSLNGCIETIIRTYKVTDACGNFINVTQNLIRTIDTQAPIWNTQPGQLNVTIECSNVNALANAQALFPSASDLCDTNVTNIVKSSGQFVTAGGCSSVGTYTNTWTVTDDCGNASVLYTQVITVQDTTAPVFAGTLPQNATVQCDNVPAPIVLTATDNCDSQVSVVYNQSIAGQDDGCASNYTITRNWSVTDCAGNNTSHTQIITVQDTTAPVFASESLPANMTVQCDNVPAPIVLTATDNCDNQVSVVYNQNIAGQDDGCASNYIITRSWSVTDCAGNNTSHTQIITVQDTTAPVFATESLPANVTVQCDNIPAPVVLTATDNCDNQVSVVYNQNIAGQDDGCASNYIITRNWSMTDCAGNNTSHTQIITVEDTTAPVFASESLPANITVQCDNVPAPIVLTASDNCDNQVAVVYNQSIAGQDDGCGSNYIITRSWSVTDCAGNNTSHTQIITVQDTTAPVFATESLPANVTVQCDNIPAPVVLTATDNCDNQVSVVYNQNIAGQDDGCASNYIITRSWSVTDCAGNNTSHTQIITVQDTTAPVFAAESLPANTTVQCDNVPAPIVLTATDNCDSQVAVVYNQSIAGLDDGCGSNYIITRTWSVTDCAGNNTSHTQIINVEDTTAPIFAAESLPANMIVQCDNIPAPIVLTTTDNCDNQIAVIYNESNAGQDDGCGSNYIITRSWSVTDCAGNNTSHTQIITVEDTTAPIFAAESLPANMIVQCDNVSAPIVLTATDNCDSQVAVVYNQSIAGLDDGCGSNYIITRTWSVTDCAGNNTSHTQIITVEDTTAPIFAAESLPANMIVQCDNIPVPIVLTATDNCDNQIAVIYNESNAGQDDGCGSNYIITRSWSVTDCAGNNTSHTQVITVEDTNPPIFTAEYLPANVTVQCDNIPAPIVLTAIDKCDSQVVVIYSQSIAGQDDGCASNYIITRTWSVTDCAGNNTSHTQIITVEDTTAPVFASESLPADVSVQCDAVPVAAVITATDNCDSQVNVVYAEDIRHNEQGCASNYTIVRIWTATDCAGNSISHSQTITVSDDIAPVLTNPASEVLNVGCSEIPTKPELVFTDNCSTEVTVVYTENILDQTEYSYTIVRDWIATDSCGNSTTFNQTIFVTIEEPFSYVNQSLCIGDIEVDLFSYLSLTPEESQGTWVDVNNSGGLTGSTLNPANILPGFYVYRYTVEGGVCPRVIEIYMTIHDDCIVLPCNISQLKISKVVTPNNDGSNDFFKIGGLGECGFIYDIKVFNRWGALVYQNANYLNDWDGKSQGNVSDSNLPSGSYFYIINIVNSGFDVKKGYIYLGTKN